ncbi:hypothetical protein GCM10007301_24880 [Azorhizobium oxalatiphilum]|uniref:Uncharacterized protein n=1 Tax=Azorhizobium oxalatiphilum TaxID=980631 RepID=A0A917BZ24_9HYPH|nr:hypothetical protein [Azorhizobium oxalatiphilum]GGF64070.1 hypothetical protein GCM10007301_24880 [Azorhizobium oxalatiphilum]
MTDPILSLPAQLERDLLVNTLEQESLFETSQNAHISHGIESDQLEPYLAALGASGLLTLYTYGGLRNDEIIHLPLSLLNTCLTHLAAEVFLSPTDATLSRLNALS